MKNYLNLLRNRNFLLYIIGQIVSRFCDTCFKISLIWYLAEKANAYETIAATLLVAYLPQLLVGLIGGYLVDRFDRRKAMILSDGISAIILFGFYFFVAKGAMNIAIILIVRFALSLMDTVYSPAATAYIPRLVKKEDLVSANALFAIVGETMGIAGAAVVGIIIALTSFETVVFINCFTYVFAALMILLIPVSGKAIKSDDFDKFSLKTLTSGFGYVFKDSFVWQFILVIFFTNIIADLFYSLSSIYTVTILRAVSEVYGIICTAISLGMLLGTALLGLFRIKRAGRWLTFGFLLSGAVMILLGITTHYFLAIFLYFLFSLGDALGIPCFTYLQLRVPDSIKGRVFAAFDTLVLFATPIASLLISTVSKSLGVGLAYLLSGIAMIAVFFIALFMKGLQGAILGKVGEK